jgi:lipopolysaccharide/colanic/teichoic acid biosynthesis glycosyltransferase
MGHKHNMATMAPVSVVRDEVTPHPYLFTEEVFQAMLTRERRRAERSRKPFVLMLLSAHQENGLAEKILGRALNAIGAAARQTDVVGWYKQGVIIGVIFTELGTDEIAGIAEALKAKIRSCVGESIGREMAAKIAISLHLFPESWDRNHTDWLADSKLYPDLEPQLPLKKFPLGVKRAMDIAGSAALLLVLSPLLAIIALMIKLTSKGPVLFGQERLGKMGGRFKCLKFRTMHLNCGHQIHEEYVHRFIAGKAEAADAGADSTAVVYKLTNDPRVTLAGRILRKTSLDELPQFWNVLRGEMSLVGPRPPVPYEFEVYDIWHRRRVLEVKPGITGLWQVSGRSSTRFDDMVRLDLKYCRSWSLWLDLKILLATPWAVIRGEGAY